MRIRLLLVPTALALSLQGCGGGSAAIPPPPVVSISISPPNVSVRAGSQFAFHATVSGSTNTGVVWQVAGAPGGASIDGMIDANGLYTAPATPPSPPSVIITAVSRADTTKSASASVTVTIGVTVLPAVAALGLSSSQCTITQQFAATVAGTSDNNVSWSVNGIPAGDPNPAFGSITSTGLYTSPNALPSPPNFNVTATSQADPTQSGTSSVSISAGGAAVDQAAQNLPIELGTSGGNANDKTSGGSGGFCCSGTLGALVSRNGTNFILSNNHVLARNDQATVGESIIQPGLADNSCMSATATPVATFSQAVKLQNGNQSVVADAALASILPGAVNPAGDILQLGPVTCAGAQPAPPASTTIAPAIGMAVAKSGRTTGLTCGTITAVAVDNVKVQYQTACGSSSTFTATFNNQVEIQNQNSNFGNAGDSGSLIVNANTAEATALLFAGDPSSGITFANPIQDVLGALLDPNNQALPTIVGGATHAVAACTGDSGSAVPATGPAAKAAHSMQAEIARAKTIKANYLAKLTADPAVLGVGIGAGESSGEAAIVIFVERGKSHQPIPATLDGVKTKVQTIGRIRALSSPICTAKDAERSRLTALR